MKIDSLEQAPRLPARIAAAIMREINEGRLKLGDRLPTEQFLAESFGVSRNVVREAIAQLRSGGILSSRQGVGTVVALGQGDPTPRNAPVAQADPSQFRHAYELRAIIEMEGAGLAARRGDAAQLRAISLTLERMQRAERWEKEGVDLDLGFHLAVARASGNPYLVSAIEGLTGPMRQTIVATRQRSGGIVGEVRTLTIDEHAAIRDAIVRRQPDAAREAMARHIRNAAARLGYDITRDDNDAAGPSAAAAFAIESRPSPKKEKTKK
jgi:DNA-binding FadR family transcriptional regulator